MEHHRADQLDRGTQPAVTIYEVTFIKIDFKSKLLLVVRVELPQIFLEQLTWTAGLQHAVKALQILAVGDRVGVAEYGVLVALGVFNFKQIGVHCAECGKFIFFFHLNKVTPAQI